MLCEYRMQHENKACTYWSSEKKVCSHPKMFRCPEYIRDTEPILSYSSMNSYTQCRRKFFYGYFMGLQLKDKNVPLYVGEAAHEVLGMLHDIDGDHVDIRKYFIDHFLSEYEDSELAASVLGISAVLQVYHESGMDMPKGITEYEWLVEKPPLTGFIDMVDKENGNGFEWKVTGSPDFYTKYTMEDQLTMYFHAVPEIERFVVRTFTRPRARRNKNESEVQFEERIKFDVRQRPMHYFGETTYYRHEFDMDKLVRKAEYIQNEIKSLVDSENSIDAFYQNKNACFTPGPCEYLQICQSGVISPDLFTRRENSKSKVEE